jgi:hypothetical protein
VVKCLPSKPKALGSVLSSGKKKKKKKKEKRKKKKKKKKTIPQNNFKLSHPLQ